MINLNATLIIQLINFLLLMFLLNRLLFRPMVRVLDERRERTQGRRERATEVDAEADAIWEKYQKSLHDARLEADRARSELVRRADAERQKLLDQASAQAEETVAQIRARVRAEAESARKALGEEAERLAGAVAQKILGRSV